MAKEKAPAEVREEKPAKSKVTGYQEWRCEIKVSQDENGKIHKEVEKVKILRPNVKITEEEAEVLNRSAKDSPRQDYVIMYFKD